ncbi:MAG: ATP-dependent zinc metalloprotease FtsH [Chitinispirillales bacterium]|nr:ATP-dependent zinc metalloprotease FtsH [Chitinispirillales bacterium]
MVEIAETATSVELNYSEFQTLLLLKESKNIFDTSSAAVIEQRNDGTAKLYGRVNDSTVLRKISSVKASGTNFSVNLPFVDSKILEKWEEAGLSYVFKERKQGVLEFISGIWPIIFLIFLFTMFRGFQGAQGGVFGFGKSHVKQHIIDNNTKTFADVAGVQEAKDELAEIVDFLKSPQKYKKLGGKIPKGVLLLGSPGTGKTLLAKAVAGEAKVPFFSMSGSDFVEMFVGVGASRVRDLFETAKKQAPCIIFIDEIDAVGRQRGAGMGGGHDEREQTLNQMLVEMDGFEENSGVIVVAATNRPDVLDPALLRAGRFDRQVVVDVPDVKGREEILKVHTKNIPISDDVNLETLAKGTPGFVGADLANLVNEAALFAARFNQEKVTMIDFEEAKDKISMGAERKSLVLSEKEKKMTAYHEAGHAICTIHCKNADPLHKVTIIPRGRALGITYSVPDEDRHSYSKEYILDRICVAMGGRVAEKMIFDNLTTGAANDIKVSTELVRKMICEYGMTEMGPVAFGEKEEHIFLAREIRNHRDFSEKTAENVDALLKGIMLEQEERAVDILTKNRDQLELLANALMEHELLDKEEIDKILSGDILEKAKKSRDKDMPVTVNSVQEDTVEISSNGQTQYSNECFNETILQNQKAISSSQKIIEEEESIILFLESQIVEEKTKERMDKKRVKSFLESIKRGQNKIKLHQKNIKLAEDIIFISKTALKALDENVFYSEEKTIKKEAEESDKK